MADPGNNWKKIVLYISDSAHAEMRLKLRYDDLSQNVFFKKIIAGYLQDDKLMREFIINCNKEKISKRDTRKMKKDDKKDPDNDGDDDTSKKGDKDKDMQQSKASVEDKTVIDDALKNGKKEGDVLPNAATAAETLTERAKKAFGLEGWTVSNKRKNRI